MGSDIVRSYCTWKGRDDLGMASRSKILQSCPLKSGLAAGFPSKLISVCCLVMTNWSFLPTN